MLERSREQRQVVGAPCLFDGTLEMPDRLLVPALARCDVSSGGVRGHERPRMSRFRGQLERLRGEFSGCRRLPGDPLRVRRSRDDAGLVPGMSAVQPDALANPGALLELAQKVQDLAQPPRKSRGNLIVLLCDPVEGRKRILPMT